MPINEKRQFVERCLELGWAEIKTRKGQFRHNPIQLSWKFGEPMEVGPSSIHVTRDFGRGPEMITIDWGSVQSIAGPGGMRRYWR